MAYITKIKPRLFITERPGAFRHYFTVFGDAENSAGGWLLYCLTVCCASVSGGPPETAAARGWRVCSAMLMPAGTSRQQLADRSLAGPVIAKSCPLLVMHI